MEGQFQGNKKKFKGLLTIPKSVSQTIITFVDIMNGSIFVLNVDHQWSVAGLEEEVVDMCMQEEKDGYDIDSSLWIIHIWFESTQIYKFSNI